MGQTEKSPRLAGSPRAWRPPLLSVIITRMLPRRLLQIVRQFRENGLKLLLEHPANVSDLLHVAGAEGLDLIDWDGLSLDRTTCVQRDYRHVESDVVLHAPVRGQGRSRRRLL